MLWNNHQMYNAIDLGLYILSSSLLWGGSTSRALQCFDDCRGSASAIRSLFLLCFVALGTFSGQLISHERSLSSEFLFIFYGLICLNGIP